MSALRTDEGLARLVPDVETFIDKYWEREPWVGAIPTPFEDLFSLGVVDHLLSQTSLRYPSSVRLVRAGVEVNPGLYTRRPNLAEYNEAVVEKAVDAAGALEQFRLGATMVFQGVDHTWPPLNAFRAALQRHVSHTCRVNAYFTPGNAQGFAPHHDNHDVFIVQIHGTKHWRFHEPKERAPLAAGQHVAEELGEPDLELELSPGACVYLPRGWIHWATSQSVPSLHLTIGITPVVWRSVLIELVEQAAADCSELRAGLPIGFADDPVALATKLGSVLRTFADWSANLDLARAAERLVWQGDEGGQVMRPGQLLQLLNIGIVDDRTHIRLKEAALCRLREFEDGTATLIQADRSMSLPADVAPLITRLLDGERVAVDRWAPALAPEVRLALVRHLVREGILEFDLTITGA